MPETAPETPEPSAGESPEKPKPKDLTSLAETLGVTVKDLYALEVPSSKGEKYTLGQLKDAKAAEDEFHVAKARWDEDKLRKEREQLRAEDELHELLSTLPKDAVKPETLEKIRNRANERLALERRRTLDAIPEWRDETVREQELAKIVEFTREYGVALEGITDHRLMKLIRDSWQREERTLKALERIEQIKPKGKGSKPIPKTSTLTGAPITREERLMRERMDRWTSGA